MTDQEFLDYLGDDLEAMIEYANGLIRLTEEFIEINEKVIKWMKENPDFTPIEYDLIKRAITTKHFAGITPVPEFRKRLKKKLAQRA